jgi:hypothetical protein
VVGWNDTTAAVQSVKDSTGNNYNLAIGPTSGTALQQSIYYAANIVVKKMAFRKFRAPFSFAPIGGEVVSRLCFELLRLEFMGSS